MNTGLEGAGRPVVFGPNERRLAGWLHLPPRGSARGVVICCPPLGIEAVSAHHGLRALAQGVARAGFGALRFDYDGTGDSAGDEDDGDRVAAWCASIDAAIDYGIACGFPTVALIGLRLGATLAAKVASSRADVQALVMWDPCVRGSVFLREQVALAALHLGDDRCLPHDGTELLGTVLSATTAEDVRHLDLSEMPVPRASAVLVLSRADRKVPARLVAHLEPCAPEWAVAEGQADFVDVLPHASKIPEHAIEAICRWLATALPDATSEIALSDEEQGPVAISRDRRRGVLERARQIGPLGLVAVESVPNEPPIGPTVLFLNAGLIHHVGPARLWVSWSRRLAAAGLPAVRADISGIGESPTRPGQPARVVHPIEALDDIRELVGELSSENPYGVVLAGLCSGAYHALEGATIPGVRGVCAVNPLLHFDPPELLEGGQVAPERRAVRPYPRWMRPFLSFQRFAQTVERITPAGFWWVLERVHLYANPVTELRSLARRGIGVVLLCGEEEALQFTRRGRHELRRLIRSGSVRFEHLGGRDHSLFGSEARDRATEAFFQHVFSMFVSGEGADTGGSPAGADPLAEPAEVDHCSERTLGTLDALSVRGQSEPGVSARMVPTKGGAK